MKLSVIIPTFERPGWLKRAVRSLARQTRIPDEVLPVARDTDTPTHVSIAELQREGLPFPVRQVLVSRPGFMPPVDAGFRAATGDVIAVLDDDGEALEEWAERMLRPYERKDVGAVGGRYINMTLPDERVDESVGTTRRVGYISLSGRMMGEMYRNPTFTEPVDACFLMGGCMSYRRDVAERLEFDWDLNRVVATHYECDLGLQVRNMGLRVIFDPKIGIRHYSAPRAVKGNRAINHEAVRWTCYNETRIGLRRIPLRASVALVKGLAVGQRASPGILPLLLGGVARRAGFHTEVGLAATRGRVEAVARLLRGALGRQRAAG